MNNKSLEGEPLTVLFILLDTYTKLSCVPGSILDKYRAFTIKNILNAIDSDFDMRQ